MKGDRHGRTIGFPTVNLDPEIIPMTLKHGIYAAKVRYGNKEYLGTLFFGPRLVKGENHPVLEIYIHDFQKDIYDQEVKFIINSFIRDVRHFADLEELKKEMERDIEKTRHLVRFDKIASSPAERGSSQ